MSRGIRVLHVEDEPSVAELTSRSLEREDDRIEVVTAECAQEGLDRLSEEAIDCIVSDYDMPGPTGIEFLETVRETHDDLPFILYTGKGSEEVASEAISAGVTDYLQKTTATEQYELLTNRIVNSVERWRRERDLARYQTIVDAAGDGVYTLDPEGNFTTVNDYIIEQTGYSRDELLGSHVSLLLDDEGIEAGAEAIQELLESDDQSTIALEMNVYPKDERPFPIELTIALLPTEGGEFQGTVGIARPIDEESERSLTRERYETVLDAINDGVYMLDSEGNFTYVNQYIEETTGYDRSELQGAPASSVISPDGVEAFEAGIEESVTSETTWFTTEFEVQPRGADPYLAEAKVAPLVIDGTYEGSVGVTRDISDRKVRERELERYETMVETVADGVYALDEQGHYTYINSYIEDRIGFDREEVIGEPASKFLPEPIVEEVEAKVGEMLAGDRETASFEFDIETATGEALPVEARITLLPFEEEYAGTVGILRDITERKLRERQMKRFQAIMETLPIGAFFLDDEGRILEANERGAQMVGSTPEEWVGEPFQALVEEGIVPEAAVDSYLDQLPDLLSSEIDQEVGTVETTLEPKDRTEPREIVAQFRPLPYESDFQGTTVVFQDVTDQREWERELERKNQELSRQNERLDEFASVVSHDLRTPLSVASGNLSLAQETGDEANFEAAAQALDRMGAMIDDLLTLAREGRTVESTEPVNVSDRAETSWRGLETADSKLHADIDRTIRADPTRLSRLLDNILRNALEHGGNGVEVTIGSLPDGFYVADDGPGIPPSKREDIFTAGFSTADDGTGFGLRIVQQIVEAHGWEIRVTESDAGGARFEISGVEFA